jgi:hypothetical protein
MSRGIYCTAVAAKITMHDEPFCIPEDVGVSIRPSGFLGEVEHHDEALLKNPNKFKPVA